jgi:hypothetical protein
VDTLRTLLEASTRLQESNLDREEWLADFLGSVNAVFVLSSDFLANSDGLLILFMARAHSAFVGAVRMAASGQLAETFMLLRGLIENGLYAVHIKSDATRGRIWMDRHRTAEGERRVRSEFKFRRVLGTVQAINSDLGRIVHVLYDRCLDLGAHPNERGHFASAEFQDPDDAQFKAFLFTPDPKKIHFLLRSCGEVGVVALRLFLLVFEERLRLTPVPENVSELHEALAEYCSK